MITPSELRQMKLDIIIQADRIRNGETWDDMYIAQREAVILSEVLAEKLESLAELLE